MKWKLGTVAGIGVYLHWSFWLLPAWIFMTSSGGLGSALSAVLFVFAVFGCVVLHELGHALMARYFKIGTRDITLYPIGGVAALDRIPRQPSREMAIALAGPAVNVVIAAMLFAVLVVAGIGSQGLVFEFSGGSFLVNLFLVNVVLVLFNMLPAFPMDGGRVLRAFLAFWLPHLRATEIAVRVGQVTAVALGLAGLFTSGTLVLVAIFVLLAAQAELSSARRNEFLGRGAVIDSVGRTYRPDQPQAAAADSDIVWLDPGDGQHHGFVRIVRVKP